MDVRSKENDGLNISVKLDRKNYNAFIKDIKNLGKKYEADSKTPYLKYSILANCMKLPYMPVKGWCSRVVDKNKKVSEVFFCDYDNVLYRILEDEINYLIEEYNLSPAYIFKTEESTDINGEVYGNYLVVCLTKKKFREVIQMQNELHCDEAYKKIPLIYRFKTYVLRQGSKGVKYPPIFKCVIGDINKEHNQDVSEAHLKLLEAKYPEIPKIKYTNLDGNGIDKLYLTTYITASR